MLSREELIDLLYDEIDQWSLTEGLDPDFVDNCDYYAGAKEALRRLISIFKSD